MSRTLSLLPQLQYTVALLCLVSGSFADAALLTGSGPFLPLPAVNPALPIGESPTYASVGSVHTGTWNPGLVHPNWVGSFGMSSPPIPSLSTGSLTYDFTTLPLGYLPAGTFFIFGDVDGGSTNPERYDLQATDGAGNPIATEWLNDTVAVNGTGTGGAGAILANDLPSWDWDISNPDAYQIAASLNPTPSANPSVSVWLVSNQPIYGLRLNKPTTHYGFNLQAPLASNIPEPASALLLVAGVACVGHRRFASR